MRSLASRMRRCRSMSSTLVSSCTGDGVGATCSSSSSKVTVFLRSRRWFGPVEEPIEYGFVDGVPELLDEAAESSG
eukprot:1542518-Heterocapsa_arctica.AAC.1